MAQRSLEHNLLPVVLMVMGLVLIAISFILTTTRATQSGMWMDQMPSTVTAYTATNLLIAIVGASMFTCGLMYLFLRQEYEPLPPSTMPIMRSTGSPSMMGPLQSAAPDPSVQTDPQVMAIPRSMDPQVVTGAPSATSASIAPVPDNGHQSASYLALRLLSGDERAMFRVIMDSGGEALQKDLIVKTRMSDAKVSRVIDRLEEKGVVTKMRFGMTNKVRIEIEA